MQTTVANQAVNDNQATAQAENINVIVGCIRASGWTLADLAGLVVNGCGVFRDGNAFRLFQSEAFETEVLQ